MKIQGKSLRLIELCVDDKISSLNTNMDQIMAKCNFDCVEPEPAIDCSILIQQLEYLRDAIRENIRREIQADA